MYIYTNSNQEALPVLWTLPHVEVECVDTHDLIGWHPNFGLQPSDPEKGVSQVMIVFDLDIDGCISFELIKQDGGFSTEIPVIGVSAYPLTLSSWADFLALGGSDLVSRKIDAREFSILSNRRLMSCGIKPKLSLCSDRIKIDLSESSVFVDDNSLRLTPKELGALLVLARNFGTHVHDQALVTALYGHDVPDGNNIQVFLSRVRKKLETALPGSEQIIESQYGLGYRLVDVPDFSGRSSILSHNGVEHEVQC